MNQLAVVLGFFAEAPERQVELLPSLPRDPGARDFWTRFTNNPLLGLAESFQRFLCHRDHESYEAFMERLGAPRATVWPPSADELRYALYTIKPTDHTLWTQSALTRRVEWRLVRRLAAAALADFGWGPHIDARDIAVILATYGSALRICWREEWQPWIEIPRDDSPLSPNA